MKTPKTYLDIASYLLLLVVISSNGMPLSDDDNEIDTSGEAIDVSHLGENAFTGPSKEVGEVVKGWSEDSLQNPEELGEYAEGDILFPLKTKNGLIAETARWKNGVVPYEINGDFTGKDREIIQRAIDIYHKYTCIRFRPRGSTDKDYISIVSGASGCWSSVGRLTGRQEVNLQSPACITKVGTPIHELMHALGFLHEQNRVERDDYVDISWQNIKRGHESNFEKAGPGTVQGFGVKYDYRSVMHYSSSAFSVNGQDTIIPKAAGAKGKIGQRDGFSRGDIIKINNMYKCDPASIEKPLPAVTTGGDGADNNNSNNSGNESGESGGLLSFLFQLFTS